MAITDQILNLGGGGYGGVLSTVGNVAGSAGSIIKKVKSLTGKNKTPGNIRDINTNGFLAQDSVFVPDFFARAFDEPTYLSFRIEFMFDDPANTSRNTAYNNQGVLNSSFATAYYGTMYDYMPEPFLDSHGEGRVNADAADSSFGVRYSTERYLDWNLGDHGRAAILHNFKRALLDIQNNFPYYFTSISGIDSLVQVTPDNGMRVKEGLIELTCLEGLDLKITHLLQMYRKIVWDDTYQRWVLPDMMRYFGMRIYISEMRIFSDVKNEKDKTGKVFHLNRAEERNVTHFDPSKNFFEKANNILNQATAVSQAFLGTKSCITKALNYTSGTVSTVMGAYNSIAGALNEIEYCNNAINEVMPTICLECHMCEFDISNTLNHIGELSSNNKESSATTPKIKIKVGQVKEKQTYSLNVSMSGGDNGYYKTIKDFKELGYNEGDVQGLNDFMQVSTFRNGSMAFAGNFLNDDALNKRYTEEKLGMRLNEYVSNLDHSVGASKGNTVTERRMPGRLIDEHNDMKYRPDDIPQSTAQSSLFSALMNEAVSVATHAGVSSDIVGTKSMATDPDKETIQAMNAIGEALNAAADRIYNGPEIKSMAAQGVSDTDRALIANNSFNHFINELEKSYATENTLLNEILKNYRVVQNEESLKEPMATDPEKQPRPESPLFSPLNG